MNAMAGCYVSVSLKAIRGKLVVTGLYAPSYLEL